MTALRRRMTEDMRVRNLAANTQRAYLQYVQAFAQHFGRSPEFLGPDEVHTWQLHLVEAQRSRSTLVVATAALRFLYHVTLKRDWAVEEIATSKKPRMLPMILSPDEVMRFLESIRSVKRRAILMTAYAAGLRISETISLRVSDIDSQRMVLRVAQGKGQADRYVMLSPRLLEILRSYWRVGRPQHWLFPGSVPGQHVAAETVRLASHTSPRADVTGMQRPAGQPLIAVAVVNLGEKANLGPERSLEQPATVGQPTLAQAITEQAVVADPLESPPGRIA